jgi:hypothetical protein
MPASHTRLMFLALALNGFWLGVQVAQVAELPQAPIVLFVVAETSS